MASIIEWGENFLFHVVSRDFQLEQPKPSVICQHGTDRRNCDAKVQTNVVLSDTTRGLFLTFFSLQNQTAFISATADACLNFLLEAT